MQYARKRQVLIRRSREMSSLRFSKSGMFLANVFQHAGRFLIGLIHARFESAQVGHLEDQRRISVHGCGRGRSAVVADMKCHLQCITRFQRKRLEGQGIIAIAAPRRCSRREAADLNPALAFFGRVGGVAEVASHVSQIRPRA